MLNLDKKLKEAKNRERLLKKVEEKRAMASGAGSGAGAKPDINLADICTNMENLVFSTGESVERSTPGDKKKKKKNKK